MRLWVIFGAVMGFFGLLWGSHYSGKLEGKALIQQQWDQERLRQQIAFAELQKAAREKEQALQRKAEQIGEEKDREIQSIRVRVAGLSKLLRDRPDSAAAAGEMPGTAAVAESAGWCTGARLYRDYGDAFAREAALAAELQSELRSCRNQYIEVQKALNQ